MADEKNPFGAIQAVMLENLEKMKGATQSYIDMFEKAVQSQPGKILVVVAKRSRDLIFLAASR